MQYDCILLILTHLTAQCSAWLSMYFINNAYPVDNSYIGYGMNAVDDERQVLRLAELMRSYVARADARFKEIIGIKTAVEEKTIDQRRAFETGYVMAEIIENYRKALVFTQKQMNPHRFLEADRLRYMLYIQNAYIKIYHLVRMMHEIEPKFGTDNTGQMTKDNLNAIMQVRSPTYYDTAGFYYTKDLNDIRNAQIQARNNKIAKEARLRRLELELKGTVEPAKVKKTTNWWPVAYGWDIDYYW